VCRKVQLESWQLGFSTCSLLMKTKQNALWNAMRNLPALAAAFRGAPQQHAVLLFKHARDSLFVQSPHLRNLRHGIMPL